MEHAPSTLHRGEAARKGEGRLAAVDHPAAPSKHTRGGAGQPCCLPLPRSVGGGGGKQVAGEVERIPLWRGRPTTRKVDSKLRKVDSELRKFDSEHTCRIT